MFKLKATPIELQLAGDFLQGKAPLSFTYDGIPFPEGFTCEKGICASADGKLKFSFPYETYEDSAAVEWLPRFDCIGEEKTAQIKDVQALDYVFACDGDATLYFTKGTVAAIDDFALNELPITEETFTLTSHGSRSHLPFFNLRTGSGGVIFGLGFTGGWVASFTRVEGGIHVTVSMNATNFHLLPGEWVRNIRMLTIFWQGDIKRSFNLLRNHLVLHYIPKDERGEPTPPICCQSWGGMRTKNHLAYIRQIKELGLKFDCYWMDAGWHGPDHITDEYQNCYVEDWAYNVGDWSVNRCAHPDGLKPISAAAHDCGMKLLLWFHTFCCNDGIGWHKQHPEWGDNRTEEHPIGANARKTIHHSIDFTNPEARRYLIEDICKTIEENGVDCYREDSGFSYLPDEVDRMGINEMKTLQLFYDYWDELLTRFPGMIIDNCGGGGSRIDLETVKRSYVLWRSDYNCHPGSDPIGAQVATNGMGHFVPLANCAPPMRPGNTYNFHSGLYGGMGFGLFHIVGFENPNEQHTKIADDYPVAWHKRMLEHYQLAKPYFSGSFYALTPCSIATNDRYCYQFDRPDLNGGLILGFFRQDYEPDSFEVEPVIDVGHYLFEDIDTGEKFEAEVSEGFKLTFRAKEKPHSIVLHYTRLGD